LLEYKEILKEKSILYVEDDEALNYEYTRIFELLFSEVVSVVNGKEALDKYEKNRYDIVLTDLTMPKINGIELANKIRDINKNQIILAMSGDNDLDMDKKKIFDNIFLKPIDLTELIKILAK
jgi:CheY-like chemotaxis protein